MRIGIYHNRMQHQIDFAHLVAKGFKRHGDSAEPMDGSGSTKYDLLLVWGERMRVSLASRAENIIVAERAYLQDRFEWISLGYNGLNGKADFLNKNSPSDRWLKYFNDGRMKEWSDGDYFLLTLQIPGDMSLSGVKITYPTIIQELKKFDIPIKIRQHPNRPNKLSLRTDSQVSFIDHTQPLETQAEKAKAVITISSNSGVDATVAGTPVLNFSNYSMVWDLAMKEYEQLQNPPFPDRTQWAYDISYAQWLPSEIESGDAWEHLKRKFE